MLEQGRAAAPARYARADTTDHNVVAAAVTAQDEARDDNGGTRGDKSAGTDVGQFGRDGGTKIVHFNQGNPRAVELSANNGGVGTGI